MNDKETYILIKTILRINKDLPELLPNSLSTYIGALCPSLTKDDKELLDQQVDKELNKIMPKIQKAIALEKNYDAK